MAKVFISHSWEDNEISRKLAECLRKDGAQVWIDTSRISGGDSLPDAIGEGIEWCDTLVLVWSKSAKASLYVTLERNCAIDLDKRIIPCVIDNEKLPTIMSHFLHIDFRNFEHGYKNLAIDLKLGMTKERCDQTYKPKKKFYRPIWIIIVFAFLTFSLSLYFYIYNTYIQSKHDTFKVYPVSLIKHSPLKVSTEITRANKICNRIRIMLGSNIEINTKNKKAFFTNMNRNDWIKVLHSKLGVDDFAGDRIFVMPPQVNLNNNIWVQWKNDYILSSYIWEKLELNKLLSLEDYILINILSIVLKNFHSNTHNPSTNRCLNDFAKIQKNLIVSFQNGPLCHSCKRALYGKAPDIFYDFYTLYATIECMNKREINIEEELTFIKDENYFDWDWGLWLGKLSIVIISALIVVTSVFFAYRLGKKRKH